MQPAVYSHIAVLIISETTAIAHAIAETNHGLQYRSRHRPFQP